MKPRYVVTVPHPDTNKPVEIYRGSKWADAKALWTAHQNAEMKDLRDGLVIIPDFILRPVVDRPTEPTDRRLKRNAP